MLFCQYCERLHDTDLHAEHEDECDENPQNKTEKENE